MGSYFRSGQSEFTNISHEVAKKKTLQNETYQDKNSRTDHRGVHQAHFPAEPNLGFELLHENEFLTDRIIYFN